MAASFNTTRYVVFSVLFLLLLALFYSSPRNQSSLLTFHFPFSAPSHRLQTTHQTVQTPQAPPLPSSSSVEYVSTHGVPSNSTDGATATSASDGHIKEIIKMSPARRIENGLARARAAIREAIRSKNYTSEKEETFIPRGDVYRNPYAFHQNYIKMEKRFRIWTYKEEDLPLVHDGPVNNIYAIKGQFMDEMECGKSQLMAHHPNEGHVFYLPMIITRIVQYMRIFPVNRSINYFKRLVTDYIHVIANKYSYWNKSSGAN